MLLSFSDSLSGLFFALLGVYLFFASSATNLHFFLGVFLHFITGADNKAHGEGCTLYVDGYDSREAIQSDLDEWEATRRAYEEDPEEQ